MNKKSHSWRILEDGAVIKYLDVSSFKSLGSVIPQDLYAIFGIKKDQDKNISIRWNDQVALLGLKWQMRKGASPIIRIWWRGTEFTTYLKVSFPSWTNLQSRKKQFEMGVIFRPTSIDDEFDIELLHNTNELSERNKFELEVRDILESSVIEKPTGVKTPTRKKQNQEAIQRDAKVSAWIIGNSQGKCECCKCEAPFTKLSGQPGLEVHHVKQLSKGGSDTPENAVAVCPNCHRELHSGERQKEMIKNLYKTIPRLERE